MKYTPHIEALTKLKDDLFEERNNPKVDIKQVLDAERKMRILLSALYSIRAKLFDTADQQQRYPTFKIEDF